jgi:hypothetical protein
MYTYADQVKVELAIYCEPNKINPLTKSNKAYNLFWILKATAFNSTNHDIFSPQNGLYL